jgi:glycogen phosphorylase
MEIALNPGMPTYSGGLGILAGDTIRSAADLNVPMIGVTLLHRKGYFRQRLDPQGLQTEETDEWDVKAFLEEMPQRVSVTVEGRTVRLRAWKYQVEGIDKYQVPVFFLDADLPENAAWDRTLTHYLYGGDAHYRLCQEILLGIGGVRMLRAIGYNNIRRFHLNEGHSSLLTLELLDEQARKAGRESFNMEDIDAVRRQCVFTTHTPVPSGHDRFPLDLVQRVLGRPEIGAMEKIFCHDGQLNLTYVALNLCRYVNGVAKRHGEISRLQFARYEIGTITNGVHVATWTSPPFRALFDHYIAGWRVDNFSLRYALTIPKTEIWRAHMEVKRELIRLVNRRNRTDMNPFTFTIGFARRAAAYKRADLILKDINRLRSIANIAGPFQLICAGKSHPQDGAGKDIIRRIFQAAEALKNDIKITYLENYDFKLGAMMTAGVDLWLNTPQPPLEASGSSGMKAALNGVPSLSILDGWWIEGYIEGVTGWAIGKLEETHHLPDQRSERDADLLYDKLEQVVIPTFYNQREQFMDVMRHSIALNGSFFNTQRMLQEYVVEAYIHL